MRATKNDIVMNKRSPKKIFRETLVTLIMIALVLVILYPFIIMIMVSFKSTKEALISPNTFPSEFHFENYALAWERMDFIRVFGNTLLLTAGSLVGLIALSGMAAYILAWSKHEKFYKLIYLLFICGIMIPFYTALVPLTKLMTNLHLSNSLWGMIIYYIGRNMPMAVFLYTGFVRGVSSEILEAGRIDGANNFKIYWQILFPIMKPITATIMVLDALHFWNDFLFPKIMLTSKANRTITLAQSFFRAENSNKWELAFAAYILTIVPILIFYFAFQKNIVKGVAAGAVKG